MTLPAILSNRGKLSQASQKESTFRSLVTNSSGYEISWRVLLLRSLKLLAFAPLHRGNTTGCSVLNKIRRISPLQSLSTVHQRLPSFAPGSPNPEKIKFVLISPITELIHLKKLILGLVDQEPRGHPPEQGLARQGHGCHSHRQRGSSTHCHGHGEKILRQSETQNK